MPTCSLQLLIDPADLHVIQATNRMIVIAKPVNDPHHPTVVWQSFTPRADNLVAWSDTYGLYAAPTRLVHGARLMPTQSQPYPVRPAHAYAFAADARFHGPLPCAGAVGARQFYVENQVPLTQYPALIFGLTQAAIINSSPTPAIPISAHAVSADQAAWLTPLNTVYVWLHAEMAGGTVLTHLPEAVTAVQYGSLITAQTLKYDPAQDLFLPYSHVKRSFNRSLPYVAWPGSGLSAPPAR
ncbi:MAG TPA: hypothetical protein VFZ66_21935 [Herpetosiphonaceae bacterium]